jgi:uncharacterized protein YacL
MKTILNTKWLLISILITVGASILFLMISQISSTIEVKQSLTNNESFIMSIMFAIGFDLFTVVAIAAGWRWLAGISSLITSWINLFYYDKFDFSDFNHAKMAISAIIFSIIQPLATYAYSELLHRIQEAKLTDSERKTRSDKGFLRKKVKNNQE